MAVSAQGELCAANGKESAGIFRFASSRGNRGCCAVNTAQEILIKQQIMPVAQVGCWMYSVAAPNQQLCCCSPPVCAHAITGAKLDKNAFSCDACQPHHRRLLHAAAAAAAHTTGHLSTTSSSPQTLTTVAQEAYHSNGHLSSQVQQQQQQGTQSSRWRQWSRSVLLLQQQGGAPHTPMMMPAAMQL